MISWRALSGLLSKTDTIVRSNVDRGSFLFWFCHRGGGAGENCDDGDKNEDGDGDGDGDSWHQKVTITTTKGRDIYRVSEVMIVMIMVDSQQFTIWR